MCIRVHSAKIKQNLSYNGGDLDIRFRYPRLDERAGLGQMETTWEVDMEINNSKKDIDLATGEWESERVFTLQVALILLSICRADNPYPQNTVINRIS